MSSEELGPPTSNSPTSDESPDPNAKVLIKDLLQDFKNLDPQQKSILFASINDEMEASTNSNTPPPPTNSTEYEPGTGTADKGTEGVDLAIQEKFEERMAELKGRILDGMTAKQDTTALVQELQVINNDMDTLLRMSNKGTPPSYSTNYSTFPDLSALSSSISTAMVSATREIDIQVDLGTTLPNTTNFIDNAIRFLQMMDGVTAPAVIAFVRTQRSTVSYKMLEDMTPEEMTAHLQGIIFATSNMKEFCTNALSAFGVNTAKEITTLKGLFPDINIGTDILFIYVLRTKIAMRYVDRMAEINKMEKTRMLDDYIEKVMTETAFTSESGYGAFETIAIAIKNLLRPGGFEADDLGKMIYAKFSRLTTTSAFNLKVIASCVPDIKEAIIPLLSALGEEHHNDPMHKRLDDLSLKLMRYVDYQKEIRLQRRKKDGPPKNIHIVDTEELEQRPTPQMCHWHDLNPKVFLFNREAKKILFNAEKDPNTKKVRCKGCIKYFKGRAKDEDMTDFLDQVEKGMNPCENPICDHTQNITVWRSLWTQACTACGEAEIEEKKVRCQTVVNPPPQHSSNPTFSKTLRGEGEKRGGLKGKQFVKEKDTSLFSRVAQSYLEDMAGATHNKTHELEEKIRLLSEELETQKCTTERMAENLEQALTKLEEKFEDLNGPNMDEVEVDVEIEVEEGTEADVEVKTEDVVEADADTGAEAVVDIEVEDVVEAVVEDELPPTTNANTKSRMEDSETTTEEERIIDTILIPNNNKDSISFKIDSGCSAHGWTNDSSQLRNATASDTRTKSYDGNIVSDNLEGKLSVSLATLDNSAVTFSMSLLAPGRRPPHVTGKESIILGEHSMLAELDEAYIITSASAKAIVTDTAIIPLCPTQATTPFAVKDPTEYIEDLRRSVKQLERRLAKTDEATEHDVATLRVFDDGLQKTSTTPKPTPSTTSLRPSTKHNIPSSEPAPSQPSSSQATTTKDTSDLTGSEMLKRLERVRKEQDLRRLTRNQTERPSGGQGQGETTRAKIDRLREERRRTIPAHSIIDTESPPTPLGKWAPPAKKDIRTKEERERDEKSIIE